MSVFAAIWAPENNGENCFWVDAHRRRMLITVKQILPKQGGGTSPKIAIDVEWGQHKPVIWGGTETFLASRLPSHRV